jgi:mRNA-degrading endonuclease RelE of RelBE toxin-antitoxin system
MAFRITITDIADEHMQALSARERKVLKAAIGSRLVNQPTTPSKAVKKLRLNSFAQYELRVGDLRALYNVEGEEVVLLAVGHKVGNKLIVAGEEFHGHKDNPPEPSGNGSPQDVE